MRICAIPQRNSLHWPSQLFFGQLGRGILLPEISTNSLVIFARHLECLERQLASDALADTAFTTLPRLEKLSVIRWIGEDRHAFVVLRCCTEESDTPNINFFNCICKGAIGLGDRRCERVEIANDDRDGGDGLGFEILFIGRYSPGQDTLDIRLIDRMKHRSSV